MAKAFCDRMHVRVSGHGSQTLVLVNGFGTTQAVWSGVLPWLEDRFRVIRFDWPVEPQHYDHTRYSDMEAYADDLLRVVTETHAAPCILIGHSMGGMAGVLAGRRQAKMFKKMVLINVSPRYINDTDYHGGLDKDEASALIGAISDSYFEWVESFAPVAVGNILARQEIAEFVRGLLTMRPDVAMSMAITIFRFDLREHLHGFQVPAVIVQSARDAIVPVEMADYLMQRWPDSRVFLLNADGHLPHLTHAQLLTAVLEEAL
ncbi:MAG: hypothetical protein VR70_08155 [Rhodospirillaceae bacterium BRH_c57]|nr:MAG: hypothetical protein VR70_08155 [Rhodospirillaceae bacterium BRH_c57]